MPSVFSHQWDTPKHKGKTSFNTGLFIGGQFVDGVNKTTIDVKNPCTGEVITAVSEATKEDVDLAVEAAQKAFDTVWGLNAPGAVRSKLMIALAEAMEKHKEELAALESLDNGKTFDWSISGDLPLSIDIIRYYAGWADKLTGQTIETNPTQFTYTLHEPIGVVGQIIPWNFPLLMWAWKIGPALATGNTVVLKPSEITPLTAIRMCSILKEVGIPDGVVNVVTGYGNTAGEAISSHMKIEKVAFTGSTATGRKIMHAAASSNLKKVTLELGGKSPTIVFDDADLEEAVKWAAHGIFFNHGQACCAGSRVFIQAGVYDKFMELFVARAKAIKLGHPFGDDVHQGPQVSQLQYDRIMGYIESGKEQGATCLLGGDRHGTEGYYVNPTIFTDVKPDMKIVQEEIFGPVGVIIKFESEEEVIKAANDTTYGLAAAIFTQNLNRAIQTSRSVRAGTTWINCIHMFHSPVPFGGYKQSGIGRECGEYALENYTNVKAVHVNVGLKFPEA